MKRSKFFIRILSVLLLLGLTKSSVPCAHELKKRSRENKFDEIYVTAQKRSELKEKVPISMDVFTGIDIEDAGIKDIKDMTAYSPNLYSKQNTNQNMIIIRGISSHNVVLNTPAGLFIDEINYPMTFMQNPDLVDIERVEVLRGPQGTLYGRNTESGAIKVITKKPDNNLKAKIYSEAGFYDAEHDNSFFHKTGASISSPIVKDHFYMGVAAQASGSSGYTINRINNNDEAGKTDHKNLQLNLRLTPTDKLEINFLANAMKLDDGYGHIRYINGPMASKRHEIKWDGSNSWEDENNGQALKIGYGFDNFDLLSITTRNNFKTDFKNDGEFGFLLFPDQVFKFENRYIAQEIRVSSKENKKFKWVAGLYYFHDKNDALAEFFGQARDTEFQYTGYAAFGEATYSVFKRLHLTTGLRYDILLSDGNQKFNLAENKFSSDMDHREYLPKGVVGFDINENVMTYISVAKGLLSGGYNYAFAKSTENLSFDPEFTINYEYGLKASFLDNRIKVNAALFYIEINDKQIEEFTGAQLALRKITNAAHAYSKGFEIDAEARIGRSINLYGGLGYSEAKIDEWDTENINYNKKNLPYAPSYTFNAGLKYTDFSGFYTRADILGVGEIYTNTENTHKIGNYSTINLAMGFHGEKFDFSIWSKNIFDREYFTTKNPYIGGYTTAEDGAPRSIGTSLSYRF